MKKIESLVINFFNWILKGSNKKVIIHGKYYMIQQGVLKYECEYCQRNQTALPHFKYQRYSYELQNLPIQTQEIEKSNDYDVYGWSIERKSTKNENSNWHNSRLHKIYSSKEVAINSIIQLKSTEDQFDKMYYSYEYRVKPIYHIGNVAGMRNVLINKILKIK